MKFLNFPVKTIAKEEQEFIEKVGTKISCEDDDGNMTMYIYKSNFYITEYKLKSKEEL